VIKFRECRHIKTDGKKCHSPAMRGSAYCYFHSRPRRWPPATRPSAANQPDQLIDTSRIGTHGSIHDALTQVIGALGSSRMSPRRAAVLLYGLQVAARQIELHGSHPPELE
jgi:hypothetical protein